jgi:DNA-binding NarL/FixJ family response regulator
VVGAAGDGARAVELARELHPDVVLMDLSMPVLDGVKATQQIVADDPTAVVVVLTSYGEESRILDALNAGARGYLLKHTDSDSLLEAVRSAAHGDAPLDPRAGRVLIEQRRRTPGAAELTPREVEVLRLVRDALANKQIGRRLGISERTVKAHLTSVFARIGVTDRVQAALWAQENLPR